MFKLFKSLAQKNKMDFRSASIIALLPGIVLLLIHDVFLRTNIYYVIANMDIAMHLIGGAAVAWATWTFVVYGYEAKKLPKLPLGLMVIFAVGMSCMVGVVWEFYEFIHDVYMGTDYQNVLTTGVADTMKDLANDLIGAFVLSVVAGPKLLKKVK
jgi:hypothetical protein